MNQKSAQQAEQLRNSLKTYTPSDATYDPYDRSPLYGEECEWCDIQDARAIRKQSKPNQKFSDYRKQLLELSDREENIIPGTDINIYDKYSDFEMFANHKYAGIPDCSYPSEMVICHGLEYTIAHFKSNRSNRSDGSNSADDIDPEEFDQA